MRDLNLFFTVHQTESIQQKGTFSVISDDGLEINLKYVRVHHNILNSADKTLEISFSGDDQNFQFKGIFSEENLGGLTEKQRLLLILWYFYEPALIKDEVKRLGFRPPVIGGGMPIKFKNDHDIFKIFEDVPKTSFSPETVEITSSIGSKIIVDTSENICYKWGLSSGTKFEFVFEKEKSKKKTAIVAGAGLNPDRPIGLQLWYIVQEDNPLNRAMYCSKWKDATFLKMANIKVIS